MTAIAFLVVVSALAHKSHGKVETLVAPNGDIMLQTRAMRKDTQTLEKVKSAEERLADKLQKSFGVSIDKATMLKAEKLARQLTDNDDDSDDDSLDDGGAISAKAEAALEQAGKGKTAMDQAGAMIAPSTTKSSQSDDGKSAAEIEHDALKTCMDTDNWGNGVNEIDRHLEEQYIGHEVIMQETHPGVYLWQKDLGVTCAGYILHGQCVNPHWVNEDFADVPCINQDPEEETFMLGAEFNHPEQNCCMCGSATTNLDPEKRPHFCSQEARDYLVAHKNKHAEVVMEGLEGTPEQRHERHEEEEATKSSASGLHLCLLVFLLGMVKF